MVRKCLPLLLAVTLHLTAQPAVVSQMQTLVTRLERARKTKDKVSFRFTDEQINQYLVHSLRTTPRPGLTSLRVQFRPGNYIASNAVVDFDAVERWKPGTIPKLMRLALHGRKTISVDLRFQTNRGFATYEVETAYFENLRVPAVVVQEVIRVVAARQPERYDTTKPIPLGLGIQRVWTQNQLVAGEN